MASPFVYEEPVGPEALIDRVEELEQLTDRALDGRNSRLEGPRRFGKTSLLRALGAAVVRDGAVPVEVNFLGCVSTADVAERIERAYARQLESGLQRWFAGLLRTLRPTVKAAPGGVGVQARIAAADHGLLDRLALPTRVYERTGRRSVVAFDEFQEVLRIDAALPGTFRAELETHGQRAAYVFSGSHPGLMRELFADRRHAFFAQAAPVPVGPLPVDALAEFISARFEEHGRDPGDGFGPLLDVAAGHPQRAMLLAHHLFERTPPRGHADVEAWSDALDGAEREADGECVTLWQRSSAIERGVLKTVAARTVALGSRQAAERFGLAKGGSAAAAVRRLVADGTLSDDPSTATGHRVLDPLLERWLTRS